MIAAVKTLFLLFSCVLSFRKAPIQSGVAPLSMAGGRSLEEKVKTKRGMFQDLKKKLNEAAQIPGFFEVGEGPAVQNVLFW